jgi:hypothetical protein
MPKRTNEELYEEAERQLVKDAIGETEQEIADSAFDEPPDENDGDNSLEQIDGEDVLDDDDLGEEDSTEESDEAEGEEGDEEGDQEQDRPAGQDDRGQDRAQDRRGVPPGRLREESEARRAAEAERDAERARVRELDARLRAIEQGNRPKPQEPEKPDIFADPDAWARQQRAEITQALTERHVNASLGEAAEEHGEAFGQAFRAVTSLNPQDPAARAIVQSIWDAPNPGRALMRWHSQQTLLREIGSDPNAYRAKVREELLSDPEFRKELLNGMRSDAMRGDGGRPRTRTALPPSLNSSSGGTSHRGRDTARTSRSEEQEIFDSAFDD